MNTGLRRFILRVAVGLLAFLLGVAVAWALGGLNPFQGSAGSDSYRKRCGHSHSWSSTSSEMRLYPETDGRNIYYEGRSYRPKRMFVAMPPPPPPPPAAPVLSGGS